MKRYVILLLAVCAALGLGLEFLTRQALPRISQIGQRIDSEQASALQIRQVEGQPDPVLVVGNSLLGSGVDPQALDNSLRPQHRVVRFVVEDTNYLDWYYGLRRIFADGAQPKYVLIMLNARQLAAGTVRGDIFARLLLNPRDALQLKRDSSVDNTTASNYLFARFSDFYGFRSELRKWVVVRLLPDFPRLTERLRPSTTPLASDEYLLSRIQPRLEQLSRLCRDYGAELVLVMPPDNDMHDGSAAVQQAARANGIPVVVPFSSGQLPPTLYSDGVHLNAAGAAVFTRALGSKLRDTLQPSRTQESRSMGIATTAARLGPSAP